MRFRASVSVRAAARTAPDGGPDDDAKPALMAVWLPPLDLAFLPERNGDLVPLGSLREAGHIRKAHALLAGIQAEVDRP